MNSIWLFVGFIGLYFSMQLWILPVCGIPTWMSGRNSPGENEGEAAAVTSEAVVVEKVSELEKPIDVKAEETTQPVELGEQHDQGEQRDQTKQLDPTKGL